MNIRDKRSLKFLNDTAMNPGFKGFGGKKLKPMIHVPYSLSGGVAKLIASYPQVMIEEEYVAPGGVFSAGFNTVLDEQRAFFAFDVDASNNAIAKQWTETEVWFSFNWAISFIATNPTGELLHQDSITGQGEGILIPFYLVMYPITEPWVVDEFIAAPSPGSWNPGTPWSSQPFTTYNANLAGGSPTGFLNPATNSIDNYMGIAALGTLNNVYPYCGPLVSQVPVEFKGQMMGNEEEDNSYTGSGLSYNPQKWNMYGVRFSITNLPPDPIYGFGLYAMGLHDLYQVFLAQPSAFAFNYWLLSQNLDSNSVVYLSSFDSLHSRIDADQPARSNLVAGPNTSSNGRRPYRHGWYSGIDPAERFVFQKIGIAVNPSDRTALEIAGSDSAYIMVSSKRSL